MAKLYFRFGAMGSSKTANALMTRFNYLERGMRVLVLKPRIENRDGSGIIHSRIGLEAPAEVAEDYLDGDYKESYDAVIVDEVQFLEPEYIFKLASIVDETNTPVICYGLKTNFRGELFPASKRLMELADVIEEIPTVCFCGRKAHFNARVDETGKMIKEGKLIVQGSQNYVSLCRKHFLLAETGSSKKRGISQKQGHLLFGVFFE